MFKRFAGAMLACALAGAAHAETPPLAVYGNRQTIEIAPVLLAADAHYDGAVAVKMGGVANLVGEAGAPGFAEQGEADLATNAETQLLRFSVKHPNLRIVLGVSEGLYRIVARKSAGIASVADLKGKKIATIAPTSSGYFLSRMLAREGLGWNDIQPVSLQPGTPLSALPGMLARQEVDAVVIWEPESENALQAVGDDGIEFGGEGVYRELFNLNTTAEKLADPAERARIVAFIAAVLEAGKRLAADPLRGKALVTAAGGFAAQDVEDSWKHHRFAPGMPADLLDVMVEEEQWLAGQEKRVPRGREELAKLIDTSAYEEALKLVDAR